jgi:hypothetical protein
MNFWHAACTGKRAMKLTRWQLLKAGLALAAARVVAACASSDDVTAPGRPPQDGDPLDDGSAGGGYDEPPEPRDTSASGAGGQAGAPGSGGAGGLGGSPPSGPTCGDDPVATPDHRWHPPFAIPVADVLAGLEKIYSVPSPNHTHEITVTAADFAALEQNGQITLTSTMQSGHTHQVVITCTLI